MSNYYRFALYKEASQTVTAVVNLLVQHSFEEYLKRGMVYSRHPYYNRILNMLQKVTALIYRHVQQQQTKGKMKDMDV